MNKRNNNNDTDDKNNYDSNSNDSKLSTKLIAEMCTTKRLEYEDCLILLLWLLLIYVLLRSRFVRTVQVDS